MSNPVNSVSFARSLTPEQFAQVLHALAEGSFVVKVPRSDCGEFGYVFTAPSTIKANGQSIATFLADVEAILAERNDLAQQVAHLNETIKVMAQKSGDLEDLHANQRRTIIDYQQRVSRLEASRERTVEQEGVIADLTAQLSDASQRNQNQQEKITELLGVAGERDAHLRQLETLRGTFHACDRALSSRNETIAAMERLAEIRAQEHDAAIKALNMKIAIQSKSVSALRANVTHFACEATAQRERADGLDAELASVRKLAAAYVGVVPRPPIMVSIAVHEDGKLHIATDAPLEVVGDVSVHGVAA
jgi:uncharacterized coiled-coil protein SlyX